MHLQRGTTSAVAGDPCTLFVPHEGIVQRQTRANQCSCRSLTSQFMSLAHHRHRELAWTEQLTWTPSSWLNSHLLTQQLSCIMHGLHALQVNKALCQQTVPSISKQHHVPNIRYVHVHAARQRSALPSPALSFKDRARTPHLHSNAPSSRTQAVAHLMLDKPCKLPSQSNHAQTTNTRCLSHTP
jgi:hypothetical protein